MQDEAEHLVTGAVAGDVGADLLNHTGVIAAENEGNSYSIPSCLSIPAAIELSPD